MSQIYKIMQHSTHIPEVPRLENFNHFAWHCALQYDNHNLLTLSKIEGSTPFLPERFVPPTYALQIIVKTIKGKINNHFCELTPNTGIVFLADQVLTDIELSPDCEFYVLGFTTQFADILNINLPKTQLAQLFINPVWQISDEKMPVVLQYLNFLRLLIQENSRLAVTNMVRSLLYYLSHNYAVTPQQTHAFTRAEQICGQYLSLVELHCREQHMVEWYASQMCLAPKYLSNVVKQTLHTSPNVCIDAALTHQAKSLLSSTSLSIQEIADLLGFRNQSHFASFFKRRTGFTPTAFKIHTM